MRAKANNFELSQLVKIMRFLHENGKKGFLALNVVVMEHEMEKVRSILSEAKTAKVDAVILWDMAVLSMAKEMGLPIHLSTQASVSNSTALKMYADLGVRRAVLARESTLADIGKIVKTIDEKKIPCRIEAFIHGAMCVSLSGRCFLSAQVFGKSANRGECRQPCRREFVIKDIKGESEFVLGNDFVLSPKDLCSMDFIESLIDAGIHAFKIEGRMRSVEYIKIVISAYREAIDAYCEGRFTDELKQKLKDQLESVYNRGFSTGFYFGKPVDWKTPGYRKSFEKEFIGEVVNFYARVNVAEIIMRQGTLKKGDTILITGKTTPATFTVAEEMEQEHHPVGEVQRGEAVGIKLPFKVRRNDLVFVWKEREQGESDYLSGCY